MGLDCRQIPIVRARVRGEGIVQGVGFRPFVFGLASRYGLRGWVLNDGEGVLIEVEGARAQIDRFLRSIEEDCPSVARVESLRSTLLEPVGYKRFEILHSEEGKARSVLVSPDLAVCQECLRELFDPADRRFGYPFINCTNCGPRFTIIFDLPYDRRMTTMSSFKMCTACQSEYDDPGDRRFHAQPNACARCGPSVWLRDSRGEIVDCDDAVTEAARLLCLGKIVAVKGLGGYHIACDATDAGVVAELRRRKRRPSKPFAIMFPDVRWVERSCIASSREKKELASAKAPILLLNSRENSPIADNVSPGLRQHGAMLPYTPLHHLLLKRVGRPLVMTSGNLSDEPICFLDEEALSVLGPMVDYFLGHNRPIHARCDDTVGRSIEGRTLLFRRSRGYVPKPIELGFDAGEVLACGSDMKNVFCITKGSRAFLSQYIGELSSPGSVAALKEAVEHFRRLFGVAPSVVAHDLHPDYLCTRFATALPIEVSVAVQHHHAHIASCLAEQQISERVIGVAFDGTGLGDDGAVWGGEFLLCDTYDYQRAAHIDYVPLPGGDAAIKEPWRMAVSYLWVLLGDRITDSPLVPSHIGQTQLATIVEAIKAGVNAPSCSSMGRLFDCVSALLGLCQRASYEAEAAALLEAAASRRTTSAYSFLVKSDSWPITIDMRPTVEAILTETAGGYDPGVISGRFHNTIAAMVKDVCVLLRERTGIRKVALSGGVFQNCLLLGKVRRLLRGEGFTVLSQWEVPPNDGGIALGQAVVAARRRSRES